MSCWLNVLLDVHSGCFVRSLLRALLFAWMEEQKQLMFFREHTKHCEPLCHSLSPLVQSFVYITFFTDL